MLAWRYRIVRTPVFGFASALYIIPSLALFAILGPITGFVASYTTAEIALVGYTLLILIWNTVAGLDAVPADAREAATALGYSKTAALVRVDLPLALPYIFAGLRVATATVIGLVTVTALIGLGGLGQQITYGFNIAYNTPIIVGLVLSVALAAVADLLLVGAERLARPLGPLPSPGAGGRLTMSFLAHVFGWFTTSANWTGSQGIPTLFWNQLKLSVAVVVTAIASEVGSACSSGTPAAAAWSPSMPPTPSGPCRRWPCSRCWPFSRPSRSSGAASSPPGWRSPRSPSRPSSPTPTSGCDEVDADVRDAAKAMGLTGGQVLRTVEAPLAVPFVMAGVRTASIEVVATSTLAAYVSYADLGTLVISGLDTNDAVVAFSGALLVAAMAGLVTLALSLLTRALDAPPPASEPSAGACSAPATTGLPCNLTCYCRWNKSGFRIPDGLVTVSPRNASGETPTMKKVPSMRLTRFLAAGVLTALAAALAVPAVSAGASTSASSKPTIIIGSTNFEEQAIVSNIWADVLQEGRLQRDGRARPRHPGHRRAGHREGPDRPGARLRRLAARLPPRWESRRRPATTSPPPSRPTRRRSPATASPCCPPRRRSTRTSSP